MVKRQTVLKLAFVLVFILCFSSIFALGYSYWDSNIRTTGNNVNIGDWGIPITTPAEFYTFATKTNSTANDRYYLFNDIDFSGYNWVYNATTTTVVFRGVLDGNGKTIRNLTLNQDNRSYKYLGIFPRMQGGSVYNLTLENVYLVLGTKSFGGTNVQAGLIAGEVYGNTNTISKITIINCGVRATSSAGSGGLVGSITGGSTVVNINNIKATNLKVFNKSSNTGGIIGAINTSGATININDIDIKGEVYSSNRNSHTGGIIGRIINGGKTTINRAIVEMTSQNTLETSDPYRDKFSIQYLGGFIGRNESTSTNVSINNVFFTGGLVTNSSTYYRSIGTAIGRSGGSISKTNVYYENVLVRNLNNSISNYTNSSVLGTNADRVTTSPTWWNGFKANFDTANNLWTQDINGRLTLIR